MPCLSAHVLLNDRREGPRLRSRAWLFDRRRNRNVQNTDDIFYACQQHRDADGACQRAISRSCTARAGGRASRISITAKYCVGTAHVPEVWWDTPKHEISFWTISLASARSRPVTQAAPSRSSRGAQYAPARGSFQRPYAALAFARRAFSTAPAWSLC
jgi:hypothetical protein